VIIWGNHSATQFPDVAHGHIIQDGKIKSIRDTINDNAYIEGPFLEKV
jgi:malate dehydrogenase